MSEDKKEAKRQYYKAYLEKRKEDGSIQIIYDYIAEYNKTRYNTDPEFREKINDYLRRYRNDRYKTDEEFRERVKEGNRKQYEDPEKRERIKARRRERYREQKRLQAEALAQTNA